MFGYAITARWEGMIHVPIAHKSYDDGALDESSNGINDIYFTFALISTLALPFYKIFLNRTDESFRSSSELKKKFQKRYLIFIVVSWIVVGIFLSFDILGIPIGNFLAKITKEELKEGRKWFKLIVFISLIGGFVGLIIGNDILLFSFFFIAIVTSRSLKRGK